MRGQESLFLRWKTRTDGSGRSGPCFDKTWLLMTDVTMGTKTDIPAPRSLATAASINLISPCATVPDTHQHREEPHT